MRAQKPDSNRVPPHMAADDEVEASGDSVSNTTTEDDSFTSGDCSTIGSPPPLVSPFKSQSCDSKRHRQRMSPCKLISSFIGSPFRKRNCSFSEKQSYDQPLLRCFSYEEILNATNNFHPGFFFHKLSVFFWWNLTLKFSFLAYGFIWSWLFIIV